MLLTMKPILFLPNIGEESLNGEKDPLSLFLLPQPQKDERFAAMCGEIEAEICQLSSEERRIFLQDYHISEQGAEKIIRLCYDLLGYISFFTMNPKELHVWTLTRGTTAVHAAGAVHSDMEHGFIRAEVVRWDNLLRAGGFSHAKKTADVHIEGKDYNVQDGDVIQFLFNV
jgi:ribosome-binding ATPase YchF (GTP1/OBG family)